MFLFSEFQLLCFYRASRKTFDTSETQTEIGPLIVQFGKVQASLLPVALVSGIIIEI